MRLADVLLRSQLFIALCAAGLAVETCLVTGVPVNYIVLSVIFFSSLFIYNGSGLNVSLVQNPQNKKYAVHAEGSRLFIATCILSVLILFGLLTTFSWQQLVIFMSAAFFSVSYTIPLRHNGKAYKGLRRNLILKNIVLSITWAIATVLLPLTDYHTGVPVSEILFMFLRRLFFIYSLAVIYDLKDLDPDRKAGLQTIALRFGEKGTQLWALLSLAAFSILVIADPFLMQDSLAYAAALLGSAGIASLVILNTHHIRKKKYFSVIVDANMLVQLLLVWMSRYFQ